MGSKCSHCGKEIGFWTASIGDRDSCPKCAVEHRNDKGRLRGMKDSEIKACFDGLGLMDDEKLALTYVCFKQTVGAPSIWSGQRTVESKKGLLAFTSDNMIFMQQEGSWSSNYSQCMRIPLESVSGVSTCGGLVKHIRIAVGSSGSDFHEFMPIGGGKTDEIRRSIEAHLNEVRKVKKRLAQEALAKGVTPQMIFCRFCGTRNRSDESFCANCNAPMT